MRKVEAQQLVNGNRWKDWTVVCSVTHSHGAVRETVVTWKTGDEGLYSETVHPTTHVWIED